MQLLGSVALRLRERFAPPAVLTHLHRLELTTAWHLNIFRKELNLASVRLALDDLESDIDAGVWHTLNQEPAEVYTLAETLARRHAPSLGTRTLDTLHVASQCCSTPAIL